MRTRAMVPSPSRVDAACAGALSFTVYISMYISQPDSHYEHTNVAIVRDGRTFNRWGPQGNHQVGCVLMEEITLAPQVP